MILPLFTEYNITSSNVGFFVLDNATNNDTTLVELAKVLKFNVKERRQRCIGHIFNLIAEAFLFGQDSTSFMTEIEQAATPQLRRQLWRRRGELGKLHNLVQHIVSSGKRGALFANLQQRIIDETIQGNISGQPKDKVYRVVVDGGVRWNSTYMMIRRSLELKEAMKIYCSELMHSSIDEDREAAADYLNDEEWNTLQLICDMLEPLFRLTKDLEGNADMQESAGHASHGALWEVMIALEHVMSHFEELQNRINDFIGNQRIQSSITLAWNKADEYYKMTDVSPVWTASIVLHPDFKWTHFEKEWAAHPTWIRDGKKNLDVYWKKHYKKAPIAPLTPFMPTPLVKKRSFLEAIVDKQRSTPSMAIIGSDGLVDELAAYLREGTIPNISPLDYWRSREAMWPHLAQMAFDLISVPAMSSECERVFSSCGLVTSSHRSRLHSDGLEAGECVKNWTRRGLMTLATRFM